MVLLTLRCTAGLFCCWYDLACGAQLWRLLYLKCAAAAAFLLWSGCVRSRCSSWCDVLVFLAALRCLARLLQFTEMVLRLLDTGAEEVEAVDGIDAIEAVQVGG